MLLSGLTLKYRAHNTVTLWSSTSPSVIMNLQWAHWAALASVTLGVVTAWGTGKVESSMTSKQQPWNNEQAKELLYPQPTLTAGSSIKPLVNCHSGALSRDYANPPSPVTLSLLFILSVHFRRRPQFSSSFPYLSLLFFPGEPRVVVRGDTDQEGAHEIFIHHTRHFSKDLCWTHRCQTPPFVYKKALTHGKHFRYKIRYAKGVKEFFDNINASINPTPVVRMQPLDLHTPCIL